MREKVFFDTNTVRNAESTQFLGGREMLKRFAQVADILIPEIVIEEIRRQKTKGLSGKQNSFISNPFRRLLKVEEESVKNFSLEDVRVFFDKNIF